MSTEKKSTELKQRLFISKDDRITTYENNLVTLTLADGAVFEPLEPRRLFPVNRADEYITLLNTALFPLPKNTARSIGALTPTAASRSSTSATAIPTSACTTTEESVSVIPTITVTLSRISIPSTLTAKSF